MDSRERRILELESELAALKQDAASVSDQRLSTLLSNLPGMAYRCQNDRYWSMQSVSDGCLALTGYTRAELFENNVVAFGELIHEDDQDYVWQAVQYAGQNSQHFNIEYRIKHRDGKVRWVRERGICVDEGIIDGFIEDITQSKLYEQELISKREELQMVIDAANLGVWEFNPLTNADVRYNERWFTMLGYEPFELAQDVETWQGLLHPDDYPKARECLRAHMEEGSPYVMEIRLRGKDGQYRHVFTMGQAMAWNDQGQTTRIVGVHMDVTERRQLELQRQELELQLRQSQKMEAIGTLAGGIAHDFNNILAAVLGYSEILLDDVPKDSELRGSLQEVVNAGLRARDLIKQILTFSRQAKQEFSPVQVNLLVKEAGKMMRSVLPTSIQIHQDVCKEQLLVNADPTQLHQVIINLATNAAHAMDSGGGVMKIILASCELTEPLGDLGPGRYMCLRVTDSGHGIPAEYLDSIFDPYFTTKEKGKGTGLGLSVVHGIVTTHGGHIEVDSREGYGTEFSVYLPILSEQGKSQQEDELAGVSGGSERILLVDDEPTIVSMQRITLEKAGYQVVGCTSSIEAMGLLRNGIEKFDLVITDMTMPYVSGDRLAAMVKRLRPSLPVVLCTGYSEKIIGKELVELQVDRLLMKPVAQRSMLIAIREILDQIEESQEFRYEAQT